MDALLRKLNHKPPAPVTVLGAPPEVRLILDRWAGDVDVRQRLGREERFVLAFVKSREEVAKQAKAVARALAADAVLWMAYPKKSSKRYRSDVSRDDSWQALGDLGYEAVRQVAIDDDWSALRFRPVESITSLKRDPSGALSAEGRRRTVVTTFLAPSHRNAGRWSKPCTASSVRPPPSWSPSWPKACSATASSTTATPAAWSTAGTWPKPTPTGSAARSRWARAASASSGSKTSTSTSSGSWCALR